MSTDVDALVNWRLMVGPGSSRGRSLISSRTSSANRRVRAFRASDCSDMIARLLHDPRQNVEPQLTICPLSNYQIHLAPSDTAFVFHLQHVGGMQIKGRSCPLIAAAELRVAAIADRDFLEPSVDKEIDQRRERE